jgi:hypothetical protein
MPTKNPNPEVIPEGLEPVEFQKGEELAPNVARLGTKAPKLRPPQTKMRDVFVQNDTFVRKNLVEGDETYEVPQYIWGMDDDGKQAVVVNPEYEGILDPNGTLKKLPLSKGPKVGSNSQLLPSRYPIRAKAPIGTQQNPAEHVSTMIRQDN